MRLRKFTALICCLAIALSCFSFGISAEENKYPTLDSENHALWIDRLSNMPEYARDFYDWLVANKGVDGLLANPENGEVVKGAHVHTVTKVKDSITFESNVANFNADVQKAIDETIRPASYEIANSVIAYIDAVLSAFDADHPEVFFLNNSFEQSYSTSISATSSFIPGTSDLEVTVTYTVSVYLVLKEGDYDIRSEAYRTQRAIAKGYSLINNAVTAIKRDMPIGGSEYEILNYFNNWLTTHNSYNSSADLHAIDHDCRECISAFKGSTGTDGPVCEGYARAFKVLCDAVGIPCILVDGDAYSGNGGTPEAHMWNAVQMSNGKWYAVDVTWNDPIVANGSNGIVSGQETDKWLLVGSETVINGMTFETSHVMTNMGMEGFCFTNTPDLAENAYNAVVPEPPVEVLEVVATINGIDYYSLTEAMEAAEDGDTIYLLKTPADDDVPVITRPMMLTLEYVNTVVDFDPDNDFIGGDGISYSYRGDPIIDDTDTVVLTFADLKVTMNLNGGQAKAEIYASFDAISGKNFKTPSKFWYNAPAGKQFGAWEINGEYYPHNTNIVLYEDITVNAVWVNIGEHVRETEGEVLVPATCGEPGLMSYFCYTCNQEEQVEVPATGEHDAEWVLDTPAQLGVPGREVLLCEVCGVIDENEIPALTAEFAEDTDNFRDLVLTEEEKQQVDGGAALRVELMAENITETVPQTDKDLIAEKVDAENIGMYLNIEVLKHIGNAAPVSVKEAKAPIKVTVAVPEELIREGAVYQIARIHNGAVDILDGTFDPEAKTFTFETDRFSTYALIVSEEAEETLIGDVNGDTIVNSSDSVVILRYLAGYEVDGNIANGDYNKDGVTNSDDAVAILRMLAGYTD